MKPEVRRFVDAQKRKKVETVESFYKKSAKIEIAQKNRQTRGG